MYGLIQAVFFLRFLPCAEIGMVDTINKKLYDMDLEMTAWKGIGQHALREIKNYDIANGIGVRVSSLYRDAPTVNTVFSRRPGILLMESFFTEETQEALLQMLKPDYIHGFTLLGRTFQPENQRGISLFAETGSSASGEIRAGLHRFAGRSYDR